MRRIARSTLVLWLLALAACGNPDLPGGQGIPDAAGWDAAVSPPPDAAGIEAPDGAAPEPDAAGRGADAGAPDAGSGPPVCADGEHLCSGAELRVCAADRLGYVLEADCASAALCDAAGGRCLPAPQCAAGQTRCNVDGERERCAADGQSYQVDPCPVAASRCTGAGACVECLATEARCEGLVPQTCDGAGRWLAGAACPFVCANGACTGSCTPETATCDGNVPRTCDSAGQWQSGAACPFVCSDGACAGSCVADSVQCAGLTPQLCAPDGAWQSGPPCSFVCASGFCIGECSPGATRCNGRSPQTCDAAGQWQTANACPFVCADGACSGACVPGAKRCSGNATQLCDAAGQWQTSASCPFACAGGACTGLCVPGARDCAGDTPRTCDSAGQWRTAPDPCAFVCASGVCSGVCEPGSVQCSGIVPQTCDPAGQWQSAAACPRSCSAGQCTDGCAPGAKQCDGATPQVCDSSGTWVAGHPCTGMTCLSGECVLCVPGTRRCEGGVPQLCDATGWTWQPQAACAEPTPTCQGGNCVAQPQIGPHCLGVASTCGPAQSASCCEATAVQGGAFNRLANVNYPATISAFTLDRYEVTAGRFRAFLDAGKGTRADPPAAGAGAHPLIAGSGWDSAWDVNLLPDIPALQSSLKCSGSGMFNVWTDQPGANESRPINCVTWYEAFAFCIWDGGRLATQWEWNFAALGGPEGRYYPWSDPPASDLISSANASYACTGDGSARGFCALEDITRAGEKSPAGDGRWGHSDLAGNVQEWVLDWYAAPVSAPCQDCADLVATGRRVLMGGGWTSDAPYLTTAYAPNFMPPGGRRSLAPDSRPVDVGFRCAR